jgi:hypothetical protein
MRESVCRHRACACIGQPAAWPHEHHALRRCSSASMRHTYIYLIDAAHHALRRLCGAAADSLSLVGMRRTGGPASRLKCPQGCGGQDLCSDSEMLGARNTPDLCFDSEMLGARNTPDLCSDSEMLGARNTPDLCSDSEMLGARNTPDLCSDSEMLGARNTPDLHHHLK